MWIIFISIVSSVLSYLLSCNTFLFVFHTLFILIIVQLLIRVTLKKCKLWKIRLIIFSIVNNYYNAYRSFIYRIANLIKRTIKIRSYSLDKMPFLFLTKELCVERNSRSKVFFFFFFRKSDGSRSWPVQPRASRILCAISTSSSPFSTCISFSVLFFFFFFSRRCS